MTSPLWGLMCILFMHCSQHSQQYLSEQNSQSEQRVQDVQKVGRGREGGRERLGEGRDERNECCNKVRASKKSR